MIHDDYSSSRALHKNTKNLLLVLFWTSLTLRFILSFFNHQLYADGSYFFVSILDEYSRHGVFAYFNDNQHPRLFTNLIHQIPLNIGMSLGLIDLKILKFLFCLPLNIYPFLLIHYLCSKDSVTKTQKNIQTVSIIGFAILVLPSEIFGINQSILSYSLYCCYAFFLSQNKMQKIEFFLLVPLSIFLFFSHQNILIAGPALFLIGIASFHQYRQKWTLVFSILPLVAVLFLIYWNSQHQLNNAGYIETLFQILSGKTLLQSSFLISIASLLCLIWIFISNKCSTNGTSIIMAVTVLYLGINLKTFLNPQFEFSMRVFTTIACALLYLPTLFQILSIKMDIKKRTDIHILMYTTILCYTLWQIPHAYHWTQFTNQITETLKENKGLISHEVVHSKLSPQLVKYEWGWTWPSLSIIYSAHTQPSSMISPENFKEYFHIQKDILQIPFRDITPKNNFWTINTEDLK